MNKLQINVSFHYLFFKYRYFIKPFSDLLDSCRVVEKTDVFTELQLKATGFRKALEKQIFLKQI